MANDQLLRNRSFRGSTLRVDPDIIESDMQRGTRFIALLIGFVGVGEFGLGTMLHSPMLSIQFAGSVLAVSSALELTHFVRRRYAPSRQGINLLFRTAGTIFYIACMFLNLTHCLEDISDIKSEHAHGGNETEKTAGGHHHSSQLENVLFGISIADLALKSIFVLLYNSLTIHFIGNFIVLPLPAIVTLLLSHYNTRGVHYFFEWLDHHLEPVTAIVLTLVCISIAIYSLMRKKQFLLAEGPKDFKIDDISNAVKLKNASLDKVDHVHASCVWPDGFTVSLKAYIKVEKTNRNWVAQAAEDYTTLKDLLHSEIKARGAKDVIVEPVFVDQNEMNPFADSICISPSCHNEDVGCCTIPKPVDEV